MYRQRKGPRYEHRQLEHDRVAESASLAGKFPNLRSLTVDLTYHRPDDVLKERKLFYEVNLINAKSVFLVTCPNYECIQGDFDLTEDLATAIRKRQRVFTGKICCQGWQSLTGSRCPCQNSLQFTFNLAYTSAGNS